jgi:hypothetical protein
MSSPIDLCLPPIVELISYGAIQHQLRGVGAEWENLGRFMEAFGDVYPHSFAGGHDLCYDEGLVSEMLEWLWAWGRG